MPIYWRLREVLDEKGVTPLELARKLDMAHPTIYRLVRQTHVTRITADMLNRLCGALGCQPGDLMVHRKR
jgi:DNA-binding Xre family transcriptional regulator